MEIGKLYTINYLNLKDKNFNILCNVQIQYTFCNFLYNPNTNFHHHIYLLKYIYINYFLKYNYYYKINMWQLNLNKFNMEINKVNITIYLQIIHNNHFNILNSIITQYILCKIISNPYINYHYHICYLNININYLLEYNYFNMINKYLFGLYKTNMEINKVNIIINLKIKHNNHHTCCN